MSIPHSQIPAYAYRVSVYMSFQFPGCPSNSHPFHFAHTDVVVAPVVEPGGPGIRVPGHTLGDFELTAVGEVVSDAGGAEGMAADRGLEPGIGRTAAHHVPDIGAGEWAGGEYK